MGQSSANFSAVRLPLTNSQNSPMC